MDPASEDYSQAITYPAHRDFQVRSTTSNGILINEPSLQISTVDCNGGPCTGRVQICTHCHETSLEVGPDEYVVDVVAALHGVAVIWLAVLFI
jgi:hypothetical protein